MALCGACSKAFRGHEAAWDGVPEADRRARVVRDAAQFGRAGSFRVDGRAYPKDCSGYVAAVLQRSGLDILEGAKIRQLRGNGVRLIHEFVDRQGQFSSAFAQPGDLVFFSNTFDRNRDGKLNDELTHVGIVTDIARDYTVTFYHYMRGRAVRSVLNLNQPLQRAAADDSRRVVNDYLRRRGSRDPAGTPTLAAQMFAGFGSLAPRGGDLTE